MSEQLKVVKLGPEPGERFKRMRAELGVSSFGFNQIVLEPGNRGRIHAHERQEEVYLVLDGVLTLIVDGVSQELVAGDAVRVAPASRRQLVNRHRKPVSLIGLGGEVAHEHLGRDGIVYVDWEGEAAGSPQELPPIEDLPEGELVG